MFLLVGLFSGVQWSRDSHEYSFFYFGDVRQYGKP